MASSRGSSLGGFDPLVLAEGVVLWSEAVLIPAAAGGGPVDPDRAAAAMALPIGAVESTILGRQVASLMSEVSSLRFYDYFCHWEAGDPCRLEAGRLAARALEAELILPGSGGAPIAEIPLHCAGEKLSFGATCPGGAGAVECLEGRVRDLARFLTAPRSGGPLALLDPAANPGREIVDRRRTPQQHGAAGTLAAPRRKATILVRWKGTPRVGVPFQRRATSSGGTAESVRTGSGCG